MKLRHMVDIVFFALAATFAWGCDRLTHADPIEAPLPKVATLAEFNADSLRKGCGEIIASRIVRLTAVEFQAIYYTEGGGMREGKCAPSPTWDVDGTAAGFTFPIGVGSIAEVIRGTYPPGKHLIRAAVTLQSGKVWNDTLVAILP